MLTNQEFSELIEDLASQDISFRAATLKVLWEYPSADRRVLPYLERLLHDKTPCVLGHPYVFGEIRWLAAQALAAERAVLGMNQLVEVTVVKPAETLDIMQAEYEASIDGEGGVEGLLESLGILHDMGYMPMTTLSIWPLGEPKSSAATADTTARVPQLELVPA